MTLKEKVFVVGWSLVAGGIAALLGIGVASVSSAAPHIYRITLAGSVVFGSLVAAGFAWFLAVMLREISSHNNKHKNVLFVSEEDRLIDRSGKRAGAPATRIVPASRVVPGILYLETLDYETQQALRNGGNSR